jgi:hypothetical protein
VLLPIKKLLANQSARSIPFTSVGQIAPAAVGKKLRGQGEAL